MRSANLSLAASNTAAEVVYLGNRKRCPYATGYGYQGTALITERTKAAPSSPVAAASFMYSRSSKPSRSASRRSDETGAAYGSFSPYFG